MLLADMIKSLNNNALQQGGRDSRFVFDNANVAAQAAAVSAVDGEYKNRCIYGVEGENWESVLDQYIQERKAAGVDDIVAEYQKQLDAYMAANNIQ